MGMCSPRSLAIVAADSLISICRQASATGRSMWLQKFFHDENIIHSHIFSVL